MGVGGRIDRALVFLQAAGMFAVMEGEQVLPRSSSRKQTNGTHPSIFECIQFNEWRLSFCEDNNLIGIFLVTLHHAGRFSTLCMHHRSEGNI